MSSAPRSAAGGASVVGAGVSVDGYVAAIDVGGTKIAGGLVDSAGRVLRATVRPTPSADTGAASAAPTADDVMGAVYAVLDELSGAPEWDAATAVGIGSAGPVDVARGTVSPVNIPAWREFPLVAQTARHPAVGHRPLTLAGDAVAMAAGEHLHGAAAGCANALCIVVSTGVGGGLVLSGRVMPGATGNAGHIGHISVDLDGEPCPCGGRGCVERLASGPAITRRALSFGWVPRGPGLERSAAAVARSAADGDRAAVAAFDRAAQALAAGIAAAAALVELDRVVVGGGVAQAGDLLFGPLRGWLAEYATLAFTRSITVVPASLGTQAGLVGAAACARSGAFPVHRAGLGSLALALPR